jgi:hypothetical protein
MIKINAKNNSDIIVNHIINKIISLSVYKSFKRKIEKQIPEECYNYIKESITSVISCLYIFYDKDEDRSIKEKSYFNSDIEEIKKDLIIDSDKTNLDSFKNDNETFLNNIFFSNNYSSRENNWDLVDEPISTNLDRYSSTLIKFQERNEPLENKYNPIQEKIIEEEEYQEKKQEKNETITNRRKSTISNIFNYPSNKYLTYEDKNKKVKMSDIDKELKTLDLEPEKNYENKYIVKLRELFEQKQKEKDMIIQKDREEKGRIIRKQKLEQENIRKYIGKKINKDHNGEIIYIKSINPSNFKKDFIFSNSKYKTLNTIKSPIKLKKQELSEENIKDKNEEKNQKEKTIMNLKSNKSKLKLTNNIDKKSKENISEIKSNSLNKKIPMIISGSNFHLMNMEVGVSLKDDKNYKSGGLDFFNKYKKYSIEVYNKKLREAENPDNLNKKIDILNEPKYQTIEEMHNLYKTNYTLGNSTYDGYNSTVVLNTETNIFNKRSNNTSSLLNNFSKQANKTKSNLTPIINMKLGASSILQSNDKPNIFAGKGKANSIKSRNIFKEKMSKTINENILNDMNTFTRNLIINKKDNNFNEKVMNTTGNIKGIYYPGKPNMREIIQEIGVKGKIRRERNRFLPAIKSNILDNENFFKL